MENNINDILNGYIDRVYGYSINNTFSREEADELSQEILFTVIKQYPTLINKDKFEPWLWSVAGNVTKVFRRTWGKQRAMYSYDALEDVLQYTDDYSFLDDEVYGQMRTKIAQLSRIYRDIIILHYYDNLSCKQIAEKLNIPEGTVTWRLSEGRRKLKKECADMTENALKPVSLDISIHGSGNYDGKERPFPNTFIDDALSQNILYNCYREAKTVEDLSKLCGVPAFYIEDAVSRLISREALIEPSKGKFQTDFLIYGDEQAEYAERALKLVGEIADEFCEKLKSFTEAVLDLNVYTAGKPANELCYLFGILSMEHLNKNYNPLKEVSFKVKYDGNAWAYHGHITGAKRNAGLGSQKSLNLGTDGTFSHYAYNFGGFAYRDMMYDYQINVCEKVFFKRELSENEKETAANLVKEGYLRHNSDGEIAVNMPIFTLEQKNVFYSLIDNHFDKIAPKIADVSKRYTEGYMKVFPNHLKEEVERAMNFFFVGGIYANIIIFSQDNRLIEKPSPNSWCDVMMQLNK